MNDKLSRAETFLQLYRRLEGALEKRFGGRESGSVVMEYLRDEDSDPYRYELNVCREIRNLLSHNADKDGNPVVEPSDAVIESLEQILDHVMRPQLAIAYGTPKEKIFGAHPNDPVLDVMRRMTRQGYSHVPVMERGKMVGVFSVGSVFSYLEKHGLEALDNRSRIGQLEEELLLERQGAEKYVFMPEDATILQVRAAFEEKKGRNSRLSAVFITRTGNKEESLIAMLTPWDVLKDSANAD